MIIGALLGGFSAALVGFGWAYVSSQPTARSWDELNAAQDAGATNGAWLGAFGGALLMLLIANWMLRRGQWPAPQEIH